MNATNIMLSKRRQMQKSTWYVIHSEWLKALWGGLLRWGFFLEVNYMATFTSWKVIQLCIYAQGLFGDGIVLYLDYGAGYTNL